jgi:hypothetical protein
MKKIVLVLLVLASLAYAKKSNDFALGVVTGGDDISLAFK